MTTTVLADCPTCETQRDAKIVDCDGCFEIYRDAGGDPEAYDPVFGCEHLVCTACGFSI